MRNVAIFALLAAMTAFGALVVACGDAKAPSNMDPAAAASSAAPSGTDLPATPSSAK
jgi:hypothetical protein